MKKTIRPEVAEKLGYDKEEVAKIEKTISEAQVVEVSDDYIKGFKVGAEFMSNAFMAQFKKLQDAMFEVTLELNEMAKHPAELK